MGRLYDLLFEVSNEDRHRILLGLDKDRLNVTGLSRKLNIAKQEVSRHISRLSEVGLAHKEADGYYHLTQYGDLVLKQLEALEFVSRHRDYFTSHSLAHLSHEFVHRIAELASSRFVSDISASLYSVERLIRDAEEYIWAITDHYPISIFALYAEAFRQGVRTRTLEPKDWIVPREISKGYLDLEAEHRGTVDRARKDGLLEEGLLDRLDVYIYLSEREVGMLCFPLSDGRFDYLGFMSTDERVHKWCRDLFQYYWERSSDREGLARKLYDWILDKPKVIRHLQDIVDGKHIPSGREPVSQLERMRLVKRGKPTILGDMVYVKLRGRRGK